MYTQSAGECRFIFTFYDAESILFQSCNSSNNILLLLDSYHSIMLLRFVLVSIHIIHTTVHKVYASIFFHSIMNLFIYRFLECLYYTYYCINKEYVFKYLDFLPFKECFVAIPTSFFFN